MYAWKRSENFKGSLQMIAILNALSPTLNITENMRSVDAFNGKVIHVLYTLNLFYIH